MIITDFLHKINSKLRKNNIFITKNKHPTI